MAVITDKDVRAAYEKFMVEQWKLTSDEALRLAQRCLGEKTGEMRSFIESSAMKEHPLYPIIIYILNDIVDHAKAIDQLGVSKVSLLHVRHIEEVCAVGMFVLLEKEHHNEFGWRWNSFEKMHAIRNRILNLKQPLDVEMAAYLAENISQMKEYLHPRFDVDVEKCKSLWEKYSNWLMGINLKDVFEKIGRSQSYSSAAYEWNSQAVHLSPIAGDYLGYEVEHMEPGQIAIESVETWTFGVYRACTQMVAEPDVLWDCYFKLVILDSYRLLVNIPKRYFKLCDRGGRYAHLTNALLQQPCDAEIVKNVAIGTPPINPYVLSFSDA